MAAEARTDIYHRRPFRFFVSLPERRVVAVSDCPECGFALAQTTGKATVDEEAIHFFECSECGYTWTASIL
jgi:Zn ribbon nucleic-acid-binding protein